MQKEDKKQYDTNRIKKSLATRDRNLQHNNKFGSYVAETMVEAFAKGAPLLTACHLAGITAQTYYNWLYKGDKGDPKYADFARRCREAKAQWEMAKMEEVDLGLPGWQAKAWLLERSSPQNFGLKKMDDRMPAEDLALGAIPLIIQALGAEATQGAIAEYVGQQGRPKLLPETIEAEFTEAKPKKKKAKKKGKKP